MNTTDRLWAAHLLRRAGFGGTPEEIDSYAALGFEAALDRLLHPAAVDDGASAGLINRAAASLNAGAQIVDGQALWLLRMLTTQRPLQEKMALFWHNHFATSVQKVHDPALMYLQNALFLSRGLGRFDDLLLGVARDPAMIFWLDNNTNRRGHPNENWGREVMELFTIGIGSYTEADVKEVARAFTGWSATRDGAFQFLRNQHDSGVKTVLGQTGAFDGGDVLTILAGRRETGLLLGRKLWRWFVSDTPPADGVNRLADVYMQSNHDMGAMLRALFLSPEFRSGAAYYATVKNPPEFLAGLLKSTGAARALGDNPTAPLLRSLARAVDGMGMPLYAPPNVGGWPGGRVWMNPATYFVRANFAEQMLNTALVDAAGLVRGLGATAPAAIVDAVLDWALPGAPAAPLRSPLITYLGAAPSALKLAGLLRLVFSSPSYQMN
jgi:uncharacterized protein (DUF1800 family)